MGRFGLITLAVLTGCANVPEIGERVAPDLRDAPFPKLLPIDGLLAQTPAPQEEAAEITAGLDARVARLRARADALRGAVIDPATRQRMQDGVAG